MKLLSWNLRGLGNPRGFISLHEQIAKEDPDLVFLQEMKVTSNYFTSKKFSLGFDNAFVVDCVWRSGVLAILWKKDIDFTLLQFSNNHIHGVISVGMNGESCHDLWQITGVYGQPESSWRGELWNLLRSMKVSSDIPWLVLGDFNEIMSWDEKWGVHDRLENQIESFRSMIADCGLSDLGFSSTPFT